MTKAKIAEELENIINKCFSEHEDMEQVVSDLEDLIKAIGE